MRPRRSSATARRTRLRASSSVRARRIRRAAPRSGSRPPSRGRKLGNPTGPSPFDQRIEAALDASFTRDPTRAAAFDRLFRRVRDRKDSDKLLDLVGRRLEVTDDPQEIAKLYWEMARVLREKGDPEGALEALEHVTMFDENHVGALALTGEIFIRRGMFAEAAEKLARLATIEAAPPKNRITAGVAAVDLYENKLGRHDLALQVLLALCTMRSSRRCPSASGSRAPRRGRAAWAEATRILEELMNERPERDGRIEAARLAIAIHRDRLHSPHRAIAAVDEAPRGVAGRRRGARRRRRPRPERPAAPAAARARTRRHPARAPRVAREPRQPAEARAHLACARRREPRAVGPLVRGRARRTGRLERADDRAARQQEAAPAPGRF